MRYFLMFGAGALNEWGQISVSEYALAHPIEGLMVGIGFAFGLYLLLGKK